MLTIFDNSETFSGRVYDFLIPNEAANCLLFGILDGLRHGSWATNSPLLATLEMDRSIRAVALRTPPHNLIISCADTDAASDLADELSGRRLNFPGIIGESAAALAFAQRWSELRGARLHMQMEQRIYSLTQVTKPSGVSGQMRFCSPSDEVLAKTWMLAFGHDTNTEFADPAFAEEIVHDFLARKNRELVFWELDGEPVSMAGCSGSTPNGIRINAVYTPPENRRRGYAGACVAELSQNLLARGKQFCFLFTDLSNPTSNHVYQQIGYRPVCDSTVFSFTGQSF